MQAPLFSFTEINALALSGRFASSSPKGRASGETENFARNAKASHFGEGGIAKQ